MKAATAAAAVSTAARRSSETQVREAGRYDRAFYSSMAIVLGATVVAGFGPTYYFRFFGQGPKATLTGGPFTTVVHVHGALFTSWVVLFIVQTALVAGRRVAVHRRLGIAGAVLAGAMVIAGCSIAIATAARGSAPAGMDPLSFLVIPIFDLILFVGFITTALALRRDRETHKRLMLLAYVSVVTAAIARLPGVLQIGPPAFFGLAFMVIVVGALYDFITRRRVHPAYLWGGSLFAVSVPLRLLISGTATWRALAEWLTR